MSSTFFGGHGMVGELRRVMVCPPRNAGWNSPVGTGQWQRLGFRHAPDFQPAQKQHDRLCSVLATSGAEVICLPTRDSHSLDAVYSHDSSFVTDSGAILMNPGKPNRVAEAAAHADLYAGLGIPILGRVCAPGCSEAGDMVWLDSRTLLIGRG